MELTWTQEAFANSFHVIEVIEQNPSWLKGYLESKFVNIDNNIDWHKETLS